MNSGEPQEEGRRQPLRESETHTRGRIAFDGASSVDVAAVDIAAVACIAVADRRRDR